ncbi:MAG: hypothetical protein PHV82_07780 [Victivallaceae bacterium]|nr:hypothetical protein [Victivallaceae bacterium]
MKRIKQPYTVQIDSRYENEVKTYVKAVAEKTGRLKCHIVTDLVLTGMEAKPLARKLHKLNKAIVVE